MYIISNQDMEQLIEFTELMLQTQTGSGLRMLNKKRMAHLLIRKMRSKKPFTMSELSDEVKRFIRQR